MSAILTRRSLLRGLFAMPAVVAASSLMPVRGIIVPVYPLESFREEFERRWALAYAITRKQIDDNLYTRHFVQEFPFDATITEFAA